MMHAPGSPPELNSSKSSKSSSSLPSSYVDENLSTDFSNFEEIGLDDDEPIAQFGPASDRSTTSSVSKHTRPRYGTLPLRDYSYNRPLVHKTRPSRTRDRPDAEDYPNRLGDGGRSRTPSPASFNLGMKKDTPPRRFASLTVDSMPIRKPRKTAKELEEECQEEDADDDDIPDDVVFWNVPISPAPPPPDDTETTPRPHLVTGLGLRPHSEYQPRSSSRLVQDSIHGQTLEVPSEQKRPLSSPVPLSPSPERPHPRPLYPAGRNLSVGTFPLSPLPPNSQPKVRSTSWTAAMDQLSDEAQVLTEILEIQESLAEGNTRDPRSWQTHSKSTSSLASIASVELPPLRKLNVMIDPLPPSKEKLTVLTRTRPSWLPPKSKSEERRHLREYEKMVLASQATLRKKMEQEKAEAQTQERSRANIARLWDEVVMPHWDTMIGEPRTRELWWRGISTKSRGVAWKRAVKNDLGLTEVSFVAALKRSKEMQQLLSREEAASPILDDKTRREQAALFSKIDMDVANTYRHLNIFQYPGPLADHILDVTHAYMAYVPSYQFHSSIARLAGIMLLHLSPPEAFIVLANLLNRPLPLSFAIKDQKQIGLAYDSAQNALKYKLPTLAAHFETNLHLPPSYYIGPLFTSLFTRNFDIEIVQRVLDVYVFEGDSFITRAVVGVCTMLESKLYGSREEVISLLAGSTQWTAKNEDEVMQIIREAGREEKTNRDDQ